MPGMCYKYVPNCSPTTAPMLGFMWLLIFGVNLLAVADFRGKCIKKLRSEYIFGYLDIIYLDIIILCYLKS